MAKATRQRRLWDAYRFPGFRPEPSVRGFFGDPQARILTLRRRSKKRSAGSAVGCAWAGTTVASVRRAICPTVRCVSPRDPLGPIFAQPRSKPTAVVSAAIQPATSPDRTRLEADPTPRNAQPVLRDTSRSAQSRQRLLRWLAPTQQSAASTYAALLKTLCLATRLSDQMIPSTAIGFRYSNNLQWKKRALLFSARVRLNCHQT